MVSKPEARSQKPYPSANCQVLRTPVSKPSVTNFVQALVAVLAGNAAYFLLLPSLPPQARHVPLQIDLGLVVDSWFCLVAWGIVKAVSRRKSQSKLGKR